MKLIKALLLAAAVFLAGKEAGAQIKDPTTWTYEAKRKYGNHFEVYFHVKLAPTWHIYALDPGGDGSMIAPSFAFAGNKQVKLLGKMKETGKPKEEVMEGIDGKVRSFSGEATFVQEVEIAGTAPVTVTGSHEYQVCNDKICLPPKRKDFSVSIKP